MNKIAAIIEPLLSEDDVARIVEEKGCSIERRDRHLVKGKPFVRMEFVLARSVTTGSNAETRRASLFALTLKGNATKKRGTTHPYIPEADLKMTLGQLGVTLG